MTRFPAGSLLVRVSAPVLLGAAAACGGDTAGPGSDEPLPPAVPIAFEDSVSVRFGSGDTLVRYRFVTDSTTEYTIFAHSDSAPLQILITDTTGQTSFIGLALEADPERTVPLLGQRSSNEVLTIGRHFDVRLRTPRTGSGRLFLYRMRPEPEHRSAGFLVNDTVSGEWFEHSADVDEFTFTVPASGEIIMFAEVLDPSLHLQTQLYLYGPGGVDPMATMSARSGVDMELSTFGRRSLPSGTATVRVRPENPAWHRTAATPGRFRFQVRPIVRTPETLPVPITPGDTVDGERIDHVGDVDEFSFAAAAGSMYNAFFQPTSDTATSTLTMGVLPSGHANPVGFVQGIGTDTAMLRHASGRFTVDQSGPVTVRIEGAGDSGPLDRGTYRFFIQEIDPSPETASGTFALPGRVSGEEIDISGDVDRFALTVPADTLVVILIRRPPAATGDILLEVFNPDGSSAGITGRGPEPSSSDSLTAGLVPLVLAAGTYTVEVRASSEGDGYRAGYSLHAYMLNRRPETAPQNLAIGGAPVAESIDSIGDLDDFYFTGTAGDLVEVRVTEGFRTILLTEPGGHPLASGWGSLGRVELRATGSYRIMVNPEASETGAYQLEVAAVGTMPEQASAALSPGATVSGESIGARGDVDQFTVSSATTAHLLVRLTSPDGHLHALGFDPATYDTLALSADGGGFAPVIGRMEVPAGATRAVRVYEPRGNCLDSIGCYALEAASYTLALETVDPAPESVSASLTLGTEVQGEAIDFFGDLDEFTFAGAAGQTVRAYLDAPQGMPGSPVVLEVRTAGGTVLGSVQVQNPTNDIRAASTGPIVLPAGGTYVVRVRTEEDTAARGVYRLLVE